MVVNQKFDVKSLVSKSLVSSAKSFWHQRAMLCKMLSWLFQYNPALGICVEQISKLLPNLRVEQLSWLILTLGKAHFGKMWGMGVISHEKDKFWTAIELETDNDCVSGVCPCVCVWTENFGAHQERRRSSDFFLFVVFLKFGQNPRGWFFILWKFWFLEIFFIFRWWY